MKVEYLSTTGHFKDIYNLEKIEDNVKKYDAELKTSARNVLWLNIDGNKYRVGVVSESGIAEHTLKKISEYIAKSKKENSKYILKYNDLKDFLYELGKIKEFEVIRKLRYQLFTDDEFETFKEYEKENWQ